MRKGLAVVIAVIAVAVSGLVLIKWHKNRTERLSIERVLKVKAIIERDVFSRVGISEKLWDGSGAALELSTRLKSAKLTGCPTEFRLAYHNYITQIDRLYQIKASNEGWNGAVKALFTGGAHIPGMYEEFDSIARDIQSADAELRAIAVKFQVPPIE